jgi:hypothetical protein
VKSSSVVATCKLSFDLRSFVCILAMIAPSHGLTSDIGVKTRNVVLVLLGVAIFLLKRQYAGPLQDVVHAYAGNLSVSFALYFNFVNIRPRARAGRLLAASLAFASVQLFEAFNGFGVMANTYDPMDFIANAVGIVVALGLDTVLSAKTTADTNATSE